MRQVNLAKRYDALTMVDDAHGEGVLGQGGRGVVNHFGLGKRQRAQFCACSRHCPFTPDCAAIALSCLRAPCTAVKCHIQ